MTALKDKDGKDLTAGDLKPGQTVEVGFSNTGPVAEPQPLFEEEALERTFIRAKHGARWVTVSLKEATTTEMLMWFIPKLEDHLREKDMNEGGKAQGDVTYKVNLARLYEFLFGPLVKIKREAFDEREGERV